MYKIMNGHLSVPKVFTLTNIFGFYHGQKKSLKMYWTLFCQKQESEVLILKIDFN